MSMGVLGEHLRGDIDPQIDINEYIIRFNDRGKQWKDAL